MEGFGKADSVPVFLDKIACMGPETHLNMCMNAIPTGECDSAGVTCGKSSSENNVTLSVCMMSSTH